MNITDIKVKVSPEKEQEILTWLITQIQTALYDRTELETRWIKWIDHYEENLPKKKTFPWDNASNTSIPISPIAVETIHAREVNTLLNIRPYIQVKPKKKDVDQQKCDMFEKFLDQIFVNVIDAYKSCSSWFLEKNKMGTGFIKLYWRWDKKKVRKDNKFEFIQIDDVAVDVIDINDIIFPINTTDIQTSPFLAHRIRTNWNTLKRRAKQQIYRSVDDLESLYTTSTVDDTTGKDIVGKKEEMEKLRRTSPDILREYIIYEVQFDYDIDDDGYAEQLVMTFQMDKRTILRFIYHPYNHGRRFVIGNKYQERVNRVYGKGLCEMNEHLQDAINDVFNRSIDNMTIANVKCFKGRKSARRDVGKIYPGKTFWLDDPTDLQEFMLGEVHQSNFVVHDVLKDYSERRTKVTDYTLGRESSMLKSRATATGTLALLQESGRHFDMIINNDRQAMVELAYQIIELYLQYRPEKIFLVTGKKEGEMEEIGLPTGIENLREEYEFYCVATSLTVNKEIEKQTNLLLLQQLGGIFQQMINLLMIVFNPQIQVPDDIKQFIFGVLKSYYTMAQDMIRSFEKIDIEKYLPELPDIVKQAYGQGGQQGQIEQFMEMLGGLIGGQQGGTTSDVEELPPVTGMESLSPRVGTPETEGV